MSVAVFDVLDALVAIALAAGDAIDLVVDDFIELAPLEAAVAIAFGAVVAAAAGAAFEP